MTAGRALSSGLDDERRRRSVYGGDVLMFSKVPPMEKFCLSTDALIHGVFGSADPG